MGTDGELRRTESTAQPQRQADPAQRERDTTKPTAPRWLVVGSIVVGTMLIAWFFIAWLALDRHFIDAAGESIGSAFAVLLVVSLVGAFRRRGDESQQGERD